MVFLAPVLVLLGYLLVMATNPVRASLSDGWRCVRRYPAICGILAWLAFANAAFLAAVRFSDHVRGEEQLIWARAGWDDAQTWFTGSPESLWWLPAEWWSSIIKGALVPAVELLAGIFNCLVTTFPVACLMALGLFFNHRGRVTQLWQAFHRRFRFAAVVVLILVFITATATLAKAVFFFRPPWIPAEVLLTWGPIVAAASAAFEYVFGLGVQAYLILSAYAWVRGLSFESSALREVSIRRLAAMAKWAAFILVLQYALLELPLVLAFWRNWPDSPDVVFQRMPWIRLGFACALLFFASLQAWLILHGQTLGRAWRSHWRFVRRHWWELGWFLIVAGIHCFALHAMRALLLRGLGEETAAGITWTLVWPLFFGVIGGWLLASWICLFKRCE